MNLPEHITRQQLSDAFAAMGLDAGEVLLFAYRPTMPWLWVNLRGLANQPVIEHIAVKIPIHDDGLPEADLLGELKAEGR